MGGHDDEGSDDEETGGQKKKKTRKSVRLSASTRHLHELLDKPSGLRFQTHGGPQTSHQSFDHPMNKALKVSLGTTISYFSDITSTLIFRVQVAAEIGTLVRVTRGAGASEFAPHQG